MREILARAHAIAATVVRMRVLPSVSTVFAVVAMLPTTGAMVSGSPGPVTTSGVVAPRSGYQWPLSPAPRVAKYFDPPASARGAGHRGVDLQGVTSQPVRAAGDGVIAFSGVIAGRGVVSVLHANGWRTTYEPVQDALAVGTAVRAGDQIATLAAVGSHCAPQACLHWGLLIARDTYRDPLLLVRAREVILLPLG